MKLNLQIKNVPQPLITLIVGLIIGLIINDLPFIVLNKDITIGEISNLILTIVIALYIPFFLDKYINGKRVEKEILMEGFTKIEVDLQIQMKTVQAMHILESVKKKDANSLILDVRSISKNLIRMEKSCTNFLNNPEVNLVVQRLKDNQVKYWEDLTVNLKNSKPCIDSDSYIRTEENLNNYIENLLTVKFIINKL